MNERDKLNPFPDFLHSSSLLRIVSKEIVYKRAQFIGSGLKMKALLDSARKHIISSRNQEVAIASYIRD